MSEVGRVDPARLAGRVVLIQAILAGLVWLVIGLWNGERIWLLSPDQSALVGHFFLRELPALGLLLVVALPAIWLYRLADEASLDVTFEHEFVRRLIAYPREIAVLDMAASVLLFLFVAIRLRLAAAPLIEAAKIEILGLITGLLLGILSYFCLDIVMRPLIGFAAARSPEFRPRREFPLVQKIAVSVLAIALVLIGLYGELALSWAERFAESRAAERAQRSLATMVAVAAQRNISDEAGWRSFLAVLAPESSPVTYVLLSPVGRILAQSQPAGAVDRALTAASARLSEQAPEGTGVRILRLGDVRIVASQSIAGGWRLVVLTRPDREVFTAFFGVAIPMTAEILGVALILSVLAGLGLSTPLRELERRARAFALDPARVERPPVPTDDEIGVLSGEFARMENEIRAIQGRLEETRRRAAAAELLAGVAHEVRNPLFGITSTAAALERELRADSRWEEHFSVIRRESDRLSRMIEEMLSLQRPLPEARTRLSVATILDSAESIVRSRAPRRAITIARELAGRLEIMADEQGMRGVFVNLLENAVLQSEDPVEIRVSGIRRGDAIVVEVEDHGRGIDLSIRGRLFEPFVSSRPGGTGMGLAMSRRIVEEHGGSLVLCSEGGEPTCFRLTIPAASEREDLLNI